MLKIAIVGCGKIADDHAAAIQRVRLGKIVAACDREELMARQLADRFPVERIFIDLETMLNAVQPDVVHVTTPPQSHYGIAKQCLAHGCHVYVEKPFTLYPQEARDLLAIAESHALKVTAGHDDQFCHVARRFRKLVREDYLGGPPLHMESIYGYDLGYGSYAKALLADKQHWVRKLPGSLLHNIISHGVARLAEYLQSDSPRVIAQGFTSPQLRNRGENELFDELRVMILEDQRTTAYFTFSSQMRPSLHQFRAYGSKNGLLLDQDKQLLIRLPGQRYTSYAEQFIPPFGFASQCFINWFHNMRLFLSNDFHPKSGMKYLIDQFYRSIIENTPPPIPYREILLTAVIMDSIFRQIQPSSEPIPRR
ncbi:MAG TPA: Gfo/Idh/MocA family oxidoreductase [Candidatus Paceibacterota bacterium]|nr:Gfo/Idh/MocA family oxidoreductase [Candidatus Paceibacterota bacterium]